MKGKIVKKLINRISFLSCVALIWETVYRLGIIRTRAEIFPSVITIFKALVIGFKQEDLLIKTYNSLILIFQGMALAMVIALVLMGIALLKNKFFYAIVDNLVLFLNPIPGIALFPLCIYVFGFGRGTMLVIIVHSVLWGMLVNILTCIDTMLPTYKEIGLNLEIGKLKTLKDIYIPACSPHIISAIKVALARAWRTAISVELVAGVLATNAGLGAHMTRQRDLINIPGLYALLIVIIIIGVILEDVIFRVIEKNTVEKWGMTK